MRNFAGGGGANLAEFKQRRGGFGDRPVLRRLVLFGLSILLTLGVGNPVFAMLTPSQMKMYNENGILYYDPDPCDPVTSGSGSSAGTKGDSLGGITDDRLAAAARAYGEFAMQMQEEYGTPWEVVIAQMLMESSVGTQGVAVEGGTNNWLGITGTGDAGTVNLYGRNWAVFSSVEKSIEAWAGTYVLRNGYYDHAFQYLDPNNYDLSTFVSTMLYTYAPPSDGNDVSQYHSVVMGAINGTIAAVRAEKGWPSSAELAKEKNIPIGGKYPIGGEVGSASSDSGSLGVDGGFSSSNGCVEMNNSATGSGELVSGGMNQEQAEAFMQEYLSLQAQYAGVAAGQYVSEYDIYTTSCYPSGALGNCVAFSQYFVNKYSKYYSQNHWKDTVNGVDVVARLTNGVDANGFTQGTAPRPYAIFSYNNHTGVVLGVDEANDQIIIGEAGCEMGDDWTAARTYNLSSWLSKGVTFAYTDGALIGL